MEREMKRGEISGEVPAEKQENLGEKLRKEALVVGKRGGHTTPVLPSWRLLQFSANTTTCDVAGGGDGGYNCSLIKNFPPVSARKLAATLWELEHYNFPVSKMHQGVGGANSRLRRHRHKQQQHDPSPSSPDQPESASSLRRHVAASLMQHHRSVQRNNRAIQPVLPASYESSMEVTPYNPAVTPTSSVDLNGGVGETSYSLKTSTELLKVLNRIWSLEEQHASNISLVKALKKELDHARGKIKELVRDQKAERREMDALMKQIAEDKLDRKSKEQDRVNSAIQSVRDELEDERKLRRRSESLHRKLAKDLYEVKSSLSNALKDLDRERKSRKLLEDLCDEFALGIREYEQEVHGLKKSEKNWVDRDDRDRSILHISESWLDERIQMKQESQSGIGEKRSVVDKFTAEIESYLQSKHNSNRKIDQDVAPKDRNMRRSSLESIPLNVAVSAPQDDGDDDDSAGSDSHCFELDKPSTVDLKPENIEADFIDPNLDALHAKKKLESQDRNKGRHPSNLQVKFEEQMARAISRNGIKSQADDKEPGETEDAFPVEVNTSKKYEIHEATEGILETNAQAEGIHESSSNCIDNLVRSHYLLSENGNGEPDDRLASGDSAAWRTRASPVRQWTSKLPPRELEISESSSKLPSDSKENTLKEKLLEARTRGQRSRSRLKGSNFLFRL